MCKQIQIISRLNASVNYQQLLTIQLRISMTTIFLMHIC